MVVIRSHETSSSTPYDVFLSFRGEDTRYTFTDHLYTALVQHGFRTFRDDDEMQKGECLKSELEKAIPQSKSSIIVISENYASSTWCLDELVMILKRRKTSGHVVLPVFYHVKPSELREQTGRTADAFAKYEKQWEEETDSEGKRKWMEKIKRWRLALAEVADLIGEHLKDHQVDGHESKFIHNIIKAVGVNVRCTPLYVDPNIIGIESHVKMINMWLQDGSNDDRVRAICGMGGIGKTTLAKIVYNQNFDSFEGSSFLANIGEVSKQHNGSLRLQRQLLSDISKREHGKIHNHHVGLAEIRNLIFSKRVFLVLDDVEDVDSLYDVLGRPDWLFRRSKVIITTRHEGMLQPHQMFRVEKLDQDESIKLFSFNAFEEDFPPKTYIEHTKKAVQICDGLPLALKVVGASLSRKREDEWAPELAKLESIPPREILKRLKISYDSLQDVYDKSLFLDIACFFVGNIDEDYAIKILEKKYPPVKIRIQNLIDRCLLTIDHGKVLTMHRLIQDMGREIIQEESCEAGERSRLWHHQDAFDVLESDTGTKVVEGLTLDMRMLKEAGNHGKKHSYDEFRDKSILSMYASLLKRHFLNFNYGQSFLGTLKILDLSYSESLARTPNFLRLRNLERLILKGCVRLVEVCESIGSLKMLDLLDLQDCKTLRNLPRNIGKLGSLKSLIISGCNIGELTSEIRNMKSLEVLKADGIFINPLRINSGEVKWWEWIIWQIVATPRKGPETIWASLPCSLKELRLSRCNISDDSFPVNFSNLPSLHYLDLSYNPFRRLPNWVKNLSKLFYLYICECPRLQLLEVNGLSDPLYVDATGCKSLEIVMYLNGMVAIFLRDCFEPVELQDCFKKEDITETEDTIVTIAKSTRARSDNIQGTLEYGVFSIYLHNRAIPAFTGEKCEGSSSICFTVPWFPTHRIQCLNAWCKWYNYEAPDFDKYVIHSSVKIENKTKDLTWIERSTCFGIAKYVGWLSRWRFGNQLEAGDEINITFEYSSNDNHVVIKERGYKIVYYDPKEEEEEEEEEEKGSTSTIELSHHHLLALQLSKGTRFSFQSSKYPEDPNEYY